MTTSDPRTGQHDDNPGEHRGLGKRILDAVLGEPADERTDRTDDRPGAQGRGVGHGDADRRDAGYDPSGAAADARRDAGQAGFVNQGEASRDAGYDPSVSAADARRDAGYDPVARAAGHTPGNPGRDPLASDAPHDLGPAGYEDRRPADRNTGSGAAAGTDRDFVTSSYDPDRDRGYDPQAAGTAVEADPAQGPVARNPRPDDSDAVRVTGSAEDARGGASRDYDPAQDTGYVDAARAGTDRTTGRRDDDYDTGRVDTGRADDDPQRGDRGGGERAEPDRGESRHRGAGAAAAGALAAGAAGAAAAAFSGRDRDGSDFDRSDRDRSDRDRSDRDREFSTVDDTATVAATDTGRSTPDTGDRARAGIADEDRASGGRERLVPADRAHDYTARWDALKGDFVDEPRRAVRQADELVGEVLDEIQRLFADQRRGLEQSFDHDRASTEDLRLALRRYRSFFDRLLSF